MSPPDEQVCEEMRETHECGHNECHNYCVGCLTVIPREAGDVLCAVCDSDTDYKKARIGIQSRVHNEDLPEHVVEAGGWQHLVVGVDPGAQDETCINVWATDGGRIRHVENVRPQNGQLVGEGRVIDPPPAPERKPEVRTYDPKDVKCTFNGIEFTGFTDDTFIAVECDAHADAGVHLRKLPDIKFSATLRGTVRTWTLTIPRRLLRKWRRKKRMELRRRRGRGACSS